MEKNYILDTKNNEAVSPKEYRERKEGRIPNKPYEKYVALKEKNLEGKVNKDRVLEIMKNSEVGFIKVHENNHEFLFFGLFKPKLHGTESGDKKGIVANFKDAISEIITELGEFSSSELDIEIKNKDDRLNSSVIYIKNGDIFHELSFKDETSDEVVGYLCINREAWSNLLDDFKRCFYERI